jgi:GAF domain-containing protein
VAVHHPDPEIQAAMTAVMHDTAQRAASGLWGRVCEQRRPIRWRVPPGHVPAEASAAQAALLQRYPIRAILGAPLISHGRLLGGASLVRYVVDREFTDDEVMLCDFGVRAALALECLRTVCDLGEGEQR